MPTGARLAARAARAATAVTFVVAAATGVSITVAGHFFIDRLGLRIAQCNGIGRAAARVRRNQWLQQHHGQ